MKEKEITLTKILVGEVKAQANLKSAYQVAKVLIVPKIDELPAKIGLEIKLIPISQNDEKMKIDEERFKPKSIFFVKDEISKFDMLINLLIKGRWIFYLKNFKVQPENIQTEIDYFCYKIRENILKSIKEVRMYG
jgi:hypothetical protein